MVRCTKYWNPVVERVAILSDATATPEDKLAAEQWIESFCQKDKLQVDYIIAHGEFMNKYGDEFPLAVIGVPNKEGVIQPAAESAFRNLRKAEAAKDYKVVRNALGILNGQITMLKEDQQKPVSVREVNKVLAKVTGGKQYVTKSDPKQKRLTAIVSRTDYKLVTKHALKLHPEMNPVHAVAAEMNLIVRAYIAEIKAGA